MDLDECRAKIEKLVCNLGRCEGFWSSFVDDFLLRAKNTLTAITEGSLTSDENFCLQTLDQLIEGVQKLDPLNLLYFNELIISKEMVEKNELSKVSKMMFDLSLAYLLAFSKQHDHQLSIEFIKLAKMNLDSLDRSLFWDPQLTESDKQVYKSLMVGTLIQNFAMHLNISDAIELTEREK